MYVSYYPPFLPFLFIFLSSFPFPSSMRAVSESQPSWVQHCTRACASRSSLLGPLVSSALSRLPAFPGSSRAPRSRGPALARCTWVCACVTRCNTLPDRAMIFAKSLMNEMFHRTEIVLRSAKFREADYHLKQIRTGLCPSLSLSFSLVD